MNDLSILVFQLEIVVHTFFSNILCNDVMIQFTMLLLQPLLRVVVVVCLVALAQPLPKVCEEAEGYVPSNSIKD